MLCAAAISVDSSSNAQNSSGSRAHVLRAVDLRGGIELLLALNPLFETVVWSIAPLINPKQQESRSIPHMAWLLLRVRMFPSPFSRTIDKEFSSSQDGQLRCRIGFCPKSLPDVRSGHQCCVSLVSQRARTSIGTAVLNSLPKSSIFIARPLRHPQAARCKSHASLCTPQQIDEVTSGGTAQSGDPAVLRNPDTLVRSARTRRRSFCTKTSRERRRAECRRTWQEAFCLAWISSAYARQGAALASGHSRTRSTSYQTLHLHVHETHTQPAMVMCGGGTSLRPKSTDRTAALRLFLFYMSCRSGMPKVHICEALRRSTFLKWKNLPSPHSPGTELQDPSHVALGASRPVYRLRPQGRPPALHKTGFQAA
jgi:hypothetical protein